MVHSKARFLQALDQEGPDLQIIFNHKDAHDISSLEGLMVRDIRQEA
jgi:hypothetical protein